MRAKLENRPSIERVKQVVAYDPETGLLTWKITSGRAIAGREAGGIDKSTGYHRVRIDGFLVLSHHVAWAIMVGEWPTYVDHKFGKEAGNYWENLRSSNHSQNMSNRGVQSNNTSGMKGVSFHKATGHWIAQICKNGKKIYLGTRHTKEAAAALYENAARDNFGEFARVDSFITVAKRQKEPPIGKREKPTVDELRSAFHYDPETGLLRWGEFGPIAGKLTHDGYIRVGFRRKYYFAHILIWVIVKGVWPTLKIDHKDTDRSNNRWSNLQEITQSENIRLSYERKPWARKYPIYKRKRPMVMA